MPDMGGPSKPQHHHDGYCPLCPLLHVPVVILAFGLAVLLAFLRACYSPYLTEKYLSLATVSTGHAPRPPDHRFFRDTVSRPFR